MELKIIKNEEQYREYLNWVDTMFDQQISPDTPEGEKLQVALLLIKQYEDLVGKVGSKGYVSSILSGKKPLTLELARLFHRELNIPAEVLLS